MIIDADTEYNASIRSHHSKSQHGVSDGQFGEMSELNDQGEFGEIAELSQGELCELGD